MKLRAQQLKLHVSTKISYRLPRPRVWKRHQIKDCRLWQQDHNDDNNNEIIMISISTAHFLVSRPLSTTRSRSEDYIAGMHV